MPRAKNQRTRVQKTVMLDTNLWRYLSDFGGFERVMSVAQENRVAISVAPGTVFEIRELKDDATRKAMLRLAADPRLNRLMPEAYSEAEDFKSEVRRLRPKWLRENPNMKEVNRLKYSWTRVKGGFWERARLDIAPPVTDESMRGATEVDAARREAIALREIVKTQYKPQEAEIPLTSVYYAPPDDSWAHPVEYWRAGACYIWTSELMYYTSPYREWIDGEVDHIEMLWDSQSFKSFWYYEVKAENMKRQWLRGAFEYLQRWYKVTSGTPGDSLLASHLAEVDSVLSADKNFVRFAERCHKEAPFKTATAIKIAAGAATADEICAALNDIGKASLSD
ncbi:hypothetical protein [Massilia sp. Se16.2.3]|nr:hypothetical protein [Massilia sp. Se16.2.3]QNA98970.1 hypothetical protein G4G31_09135 [Massilia sp. Se16.2.3]